MTLKYNTLDNKLDNTFFPLNKENDNLIIEYGMLYLTTDFLLEFKKYILIIF